MEHNKILERVFPMKTIPEGQNLINLAANTAKMMLLDESIRSTDRISLEEVYIGISISSENLSIYISKL